MTINVTFPVFSQDAAGQKLQIAFQTIRDAFGAAVSQDTETSRIIMRSPNGTTYAVSITDAGAVTTVAISGKTREI
jgi:hypothetical protein